MGALLPNIYCELVSIGFPVKLSSSIPISYITTPRFGTVRNPPKCIHGNMGGGVDSLLSTDQGFVHGPE